MRIIGGSLKGRQLALPKISSTRPMTERARAALFDVLGNIDGLTVLDLYAGSGAVAMEALSRGAAEVVLVESNRPAASAIKRTIEEFGVGERAQVVLRSVEAWLRAGPLDPGFDFIVADPPYARLDVDLLDQAAGRLIDRGTLVISYASKSPPPEVKSLRFVQTQRYGDSSLSFYKKG